MLTKARITLGFAVLLSVVFAIPAFAGGWAIITLDELPTRVVAGEPLIVGFSVLQHGQTPMTDLTPTVTATLSKEEHFTVNAEPDGKPGHYTVKLTFPKEGDWTWSVQAFTMDQLMPTLSVSAPTVELADQTNVTGAKKFLATESVSMLTIFRMVALGGGLVGLILAIRRKSRIAVALMVLCLLVGSVMLITKPAVPAVGAQSESPSEVVIGSKSISQVELGGRLFVAKGCVTCHVNNKVEQASAYWVIGDAPNLTTFSTSPETLRKRLKDPKSVKSDTWMPNLNLSDDEIEALISFINSD